jgi:hypothetical protein
MEYNITAGDNVEMKINSMMIEDYTCPDDFTGICRIEIKVIK